MIWLSSIIVVLPLILFWLWMFVDMINNPSIPSASKQKWAIGFILLNIFTAGLYYFYFHKDRF